MPTIESESTVAPAKYGFIVTSLTLAGVVVYQLWTVGTVKSEVFLPFIFGQIVFWSLKYHYNKW
jgi:hypothetical protein